MISPEPNAAGREPNESHVGPIPLFVISVSTLLASTVGRLYVPATIAIGMKVEGVPDGVNVMTLFNVLSFGVYEVLNAP